MLKFLISLFVIGGAGAGYLGFSGGDHELGMMGITVAVIFGIILICVFIKAIGCIITVVVIALVLFSIAYFGGFINTKGSDKDGAIPEKGVLSRLFSSKNENDGKPKEQIKLKGIAKVFDGNTVTLDGKRIHLYGIEAPRIDQTCADNYRRLYYCGRVATEKLAKLIGTKEIECTIIGEEKDTTYGVCLSGSDDIGAYMVGLGYAFPNPKFGQVYFPYESHAKTKLLGLWQGSFYAPWQFDAEKQKKQEVIVLPSSSKSKDKPVGKLWQNFMN
ncbi:MAG: Succinoglycan biosynthesis protein ExoI [Alphaproteobacteria bacterium ADurb.Bin438]|nr:MAG: Succinoglycan biosynthesis protein ExoI [Alphaproteobacteria bacterium ADurb.Bin438]